MNDSANGAAPLADGMILRAVPVTRMVDYGVPLGDALSIHRRISEQSADGWDVLCEQEADRHAAVATQAEGQGHHLTAAQEWRAASALLQCAQLGMAADTPRKVDIYARANTALERHANLCTDLEPICHRNDAGNLYGWLVCPSSPQRGAAVMIVGGLGGWSGAYLDMARALAARGIAAILAEGPGQGLTRMRSGIHLNAGTHAMFSDFLTYAEGLSFDRLGVWGNSFGGLLAARTAVGDGRVRALCVNGAPLGARIPPVGEARDQMAALFGTADEAELLAHASALTLDPAQDRIAAPMLVVQGGRDALIPPQIQAAFLSLALDPGAARSLLWEDGEHTIYNHAAERNALVADWFAETLG